MEFSELLDIRRKLLLKIKFIQMCDQAGIRDMEIN